MRAALEAGLSAMGVASSASARERLLEFTALLLKWNRAYNLVGARTAPEIVSRHLLDSASVVPLLGDARRILDIGSGAGLPGLVIAALLADRATEQHVWLLDSSQKKTRFCREVVVALGLENVTVLNQRVETLEPGFDCAVSRAVASLAQLWAWAAPLLEEGGCLLAMKGVLPIAEIEALAADVAVRVTPVTIPGLDAERHIVALGRAPASRRQR